MCGIACLIANHSNSEQSVEIIENCLKSMEYRGPDDKQCKVFELENGHIVLGHLRLSIIDLDSRANQPLSDAKGRYWIIFNGEIYNYKELRDKLFNETHIEYRTTSDTEVLLELYAVYKEKMLPMLNGIFGFIIIDLVEKSIFYARDHVGIKPLYISKSSDSILLTSEPKAIIESNFINFKVNKQMMFDFLARGLRDHTNQTFFQGIEQVKAGYWGSITLPSFNEEYKNWFQWKNKNNDSFDVYVTKLQSLLENSVFLQKTSSDVKVGTTLSGGLDSSTVASMAKVDQTFTASFPGKNIDETRYATLVCEKNKLKSNLVTPSKEEFMREFERAFYTQGEPTGGLSTIAQYFVFKKIHEVGLKVTLDGQGADELFMGYESFKSYKLTLFKILKNLAPNKIWIKMLEKNLFFMDKNVINLYFDRNRMAYAYKKRRNFFIDQFFRFSLPHLLAYEDRSSMAFSVEARVPYLDPNIIKLALNRPFEQNFHDVYQKYPLRLIAEKYLPEEIAWRKDKLGFVAPESEWMSWLEEEIKQTISKDNLYVKEFLNMSKIKELIKNYKTLSQMELRLIFRIYQAEKWYSIFSSYA